MVCFITLFFCGFQFSAFWGEIFGGKKSSLQEIPPETNFTCQVTQSPCCADQPACLPLRCSHSLNVASGPTSGWKVTLTRGVEEILLTYECTLTKGQHGNTGRCSWRGLLFLWSGFRACLLTHCENWALKGKQTNIIPMDRVLSIEKIASPFLLLLITTSWFHHIWQFMCVYMC